MLVEGQRERKREREGGRERERERECRACSMLSLQSPKQGSISQNIRS